jgi:NADH:ubiquinone oxidoreductase subunit 3 (subunit A)
MFLEYIFIFQYVFLGLAISLFLVFISFFLVYQKPYLEKVSSYECGFNPFGDARSKFEIQFYVVAILFIIFDLEIIYLFP